MPAATETRRREKKRKGKTGSRDTATAGSGGNAAKGCHALQWERGVGQNIEAS